MSKRTIAILAGVGIVLILFMVGCSVGVSASNKEHRLRNQFGQGLNDRTSYYQNVIYQGLSGKSQVALKVDSSFIKVVDAQMAGQKIPEGTVMNWIQQSNPTATFTEVAAIYKDLSRAIEAARAGFREVERNLQDIKLQHDNLLTTFPSSIFVGGRAELVYKPISSDKTDEIMKTAKENDTKVF